jgi:hypothetical protein
MFCKTKNRHSGARLGRDFREVPKLLSKALAGAREASYYRRGLSGSVVIAGTRGTAGD